MTGEQWVPIGEVSARTGVNPVTLRAWERRHGLLRPQRTGKGHRQYSEADIERIRRITSWLDRGVSISRVPALIDQAMVAEGSSQQTPGPWKAAVTDGLTALEQLDMRGLEQLFNTLHNQYPLARVLAFWVDGLREHLRLMPDRVAAGVFESALRSFLQTKLGVRLLAAGRHRRRAGRIVVLADRPEGVLDALLQAAVLREQGFDPLWLDAPVGHDSLPLLISARDVTAVLLVLEAGASTTTVRRLLGGSARLAGKRLFLCGPGLLTLDGLPDGIETLAGDRVAVCSLLSVWREASA